MGAGSSAAMVVKRSAPSQTCGSALWRIGQGFVITCIYFHQIRLDDREHTCWPRAHEKSVAGRSGKSSALIASAAADGGRKRILHTAAADYAQHPFHHRLGSNVAPS